MDEESDASAGDDYDEQEIIVDSPRREAEDNHVAGEADVSPYKESGLEESEETESDDQSSESAGVPRNSQGRYIGKVSRNLRDYYKEGYVALVKKTANDFETGTNGGVPSRLNPSQIGVLTWSSEEKESFFEALSRRGRHDLPALAEMTGKSEVEVHEYLLLLGDQKAKRHLFEKQTKQISHADIPAAIEVAPECEAALEKAADAVSAFQNQYDKALAEQEHGGRWSIDYPLAVELDHQVDDSEDASLGSGSESESKLENVPAERLFRLSIWLQMAETIFMNAGHPHLDLNWRHVAAKDERPNMTYSALDDFHDLAMNITRRVMQTSMFLAQSRMRSTDGYGYKSSRLVKEQDVSAALEVLGMKSSVAENFVGMARRNHLQVISGSHDKGSRRRAFLSYDEVDAAITERQRGRRRRRSVSSTSSASGMSVSSSARDASDTEHAEASQPVRSDHESVPDPSDSDVSSMADYVEETEPHGDDDEDKSEEDEFGGLSFHPSTTRQKRRQIYLEAQQDAYMEDLDQKASKADERYLRQVLGKAVFPLIKSEEDEEELGDRPKVLRKSMGDLADWKGMYQAEWEALGERVPEVDFIASRGLAKRRRSENNDGDAIEEGSQRKLRRLPVRKAAAVPPARSDDDSM